MNLINLLLNPKMHVKTHTHTYLFSYEDSKQYVFYIIFWEIWPYPIHKLFFFICRFLENKKQSWEFKRIFPKHILKPKKQTKQKKILILYFFHFYLSFIYYFIISIGLGRLSQVEMVELTRLSQLKKIDERKHNRNRSKVAKAWKLKKFSIKIDQNSKDKTK